MAAKITGEFQLGEKLFPFTAIAFGRIGGQNIGAKLSSETEMMLKELGEDKYAKDIEEGIIQTAQKLESLSAGKMGMSTSDVGDEVVKSLLDKNNE